MTLLSTAWAVEAIRALGRDVRTCASAGWVDGAIRELPTGAEPAPKKRIALGARFGNLKVVAYLLNSSQLICECACGETNCVRDAATLRPGRRLRFCGRRGHAARMRKRNLVA